MIAVPLPGKRLAAHGDDVLWVTSRTHFDLSTRNREFGRCKRKFQLDLDTQLDQNELSQPIETHVIVQGFRLGLSLIVVSRLALFRSGSGTI